jgi:hypothetical protein
MIPELLTIGQTAKLIGVNIQTLRRWDDAGKFSSFRKTKTGHRYYRKEDVENFRVGDLFRAAKIWIMDKSGFEPRQDFYCPDSSVFQARLSRMETELGKISELNAIFPLITAIAGEIGNNSFDHNLGNWPDISGIFFAYDLSEKIIVLADRGQGIFTTLKRVVPELVNHKDALYAAFTKIISGRAPESRGNGLKFVRDVVVKNKIKLFFQTGNAWIEIKNKDTELKVKTAGKNFRGCLALIKF